MKESNQPAFISSYLRKSKIALLSLAFLVLTLIIASVAIDAQSVFSGQTLEVSPPSQDLSADPGQTIRAVATVRNMSNKTFPIEVRIEDFTATGEEGQVALDSESPYSASNWTKVQPNSFELEPGEEQDVTATISVPRSAAGGHYGSFVFSIVPGKTDKPGEASVAQEVASLFLLRVNGDVLEKVELSSISTKPFFEYGPIPFEVKFMNTGNVHTKPYGLINISDMFGQRVTDVAVPGSNILPNATRVINAQLDKKFLIGRYTATAIMYYGNNTNEALTAQTSFIVFPWKVALGLLFVLWLMFKFKKRLKKAMKIMFGK